MGGVIRKIGKYDTRGDLLGYFESAEEVVKIHGGKVALVRYACRNGRLYRGFLYKYYDPDLEGEIWADHPLHNMKVSNKGRVWGIKQKTFGTLRKDGYLSTQGPSNQNHYMHRLVKEAFDPLGKEWFEAFDVPACVDHIDGNKQNNNLENLDWVTCKENNARYWAKKRNE
jgi:hypothetical protein